MAAERWKLKTAKAVAVIVALAALGSGVGSATSYKILRSFNGTDGTGPWGGVTLDDKGNLLGASASGGNLNECDGYGCGVVFELRPRSGGKWAEGVLYRFDSNGSDGYTSYGNVTIGSGNSLYGTTHAGGSHHIGTVFELTRGASGWTEKVLYSFGTRESDGYEPTAGVAMDNAGNLYGTAPYGGSTAFELSPGADGWKETMLHRFGIRKNDGAGPFAGLILDTSGNLYGTTEGGGAYDDGTVYEIERTATGWKEKVLHGFGGGTDGANPNGALILDKKRAVYGTTEFGGIEGGECGSGGCGTVFKLGPPNMRDGLWIEEVLDRFDPGSSGAAQPSAGVIFDQSGNLYGTTLGGGNSGSGSIFELTPGSKGKWRERVLYRFRDGDDGSEPQSGLVLDAKGNLYGTATGGGTVGNGTFFRLRRHGESWAFAALYEFEVEPDGAYPSGNLIFDGAGNLYGTTEHGGSGQACGSYGCGTVFEVSP